MLRQYLSKIYGTFHIKNPSTSEPCSACEVKYDYVTCHIQDKVIYETLITEHP
jgi:hypothetical protein